ncbi:HlyD family efflux transporter periplasmic adaptor subunit [Vallitalea pronyensis]|uniref:HlyD family efflux transporter periplasmic adaptor subunit n=1 Tax=Vallitalea pronyensis TaxID=1348613 RepID=A0A8J8MIP0_9FIRM|nr:HlyD family efflux transporter periplasmic adaptor subunit [Vallitalea pronyensis]QUI22365.1 HlyD family efflux transporter periplasmic adaptor subunit [Vallitalea pronyensis]
MKIKKYVYKFIISISVILLLAGCSLIPKETTKTKAIVRPVQVTQMKKEIKDISLSYLGVVIIHDERFIFSEQEGKVTTIHKPVGQPVNKDEKILSLNSLEEDDRTILSDSQGVIQSILVNEEDTVDVGDPVGILNVYNHRITLGITADDVKKIKVGTQATMKIGQQETEGRVCLISPYPDETTRTFACQIEMKDTYEQDDYMVGNMAEVKLILGQEEGLYLDMNHVSIDASPFVYLVDAENRVQIQPVTIEGHGEHYIKVKGLQEGDQVIRSGRVSLKEGQQVKIVDDEGVGTHE